MHDGGGRTPSSSGGPTGPGRISGATTLILDDLPRTAVPHRHAPSTGDRLADRYTLLQVVGRGGTGTVYRAWDDVDDVPRAIKVLRPDLADRRTVTRRFAAEAVVMTVLRHPRIVAVHDMGTDGRAHFVVLDWMPGGSASDRLHAGGTFTPREAVDLGLDLLSALAVAHDRGIVHRDVKPGNLLLDAEGRGHLGDFGIASLPDDDELTGVGTLIGTMTYMPPEQRISPHMVTPATDLYAVGTTLFRMITGRNPIDLFVDEAEDGRWDLLPSALRPALWQATRLRPADRPPDAAALADALADARRSLR